MLKRNTSEGSSLGRTNLLLSSDVEPYPGCYQRCPERFLWHSTSRCRGYQPRYLHNKCPCQVQQRPPHLTDRKHCLPGPIPHHQPARSGLRRYRRRFTGFPIRTRCSSDPIQCRCSELEILRLSMDRQYHARRRPNRMEQYHKRLPRQRLQL